MASYPRTIFTNVYAWGLGLVAVVTAFFGLSYVTNAQMAGFYSQIATNAFNIATQATGTLYTYYDYSDPMSMYNQAYYFAASGSFGYGGTPNYVAVNGKVRYETYSPTVGTSVNYINASNGTLVSNISEYQYYRQNDTPVSLYKHIFRYGVSYMMSTTNYWTTQLDTSMTLSGLVSQSTGNLTGTYVRVVGLSNGGNVYTLSGTRVQFEIISFSGTTNSGYNMYGGQTYQTNDPYITTVYYDYQDAQYEYSNGQELSSQDEDTILNSIGLYQTLPHQQNYQPTTVSYIMGGVPYFVDGNNKIYQTSDGMSFTLLPDGSISSYGDLGLVKAIFLHQQMGLNNASTNGTMLVADGSISYKELSLTVYTSNAAGSSTTVYAREIPQSNSIGFYTYNMYGYGGNMYTTYSFLTNTDYIVRLPAVYYDTNMMMWYSSSVYTIVSFDNQGEVSIKSDWFVSSGANDVKVLTNYTNNNASYNTQDARTIIRNAIYTSHQVNSNCYDYIDNDSDGSTDMSDGECQMGGNETQGSNYGYGYGSSGSSLSFNGGMTTISMSVGQYNLGMYVVGGTAPYSYSISNPSVGYMMGSTFYATNAGYTTVLIQDMYGSSVTVYINVASNSNTGVGYGGTTGDNGYGGSTGTITYVGPNPIQVASGNTFVVSSYIQSATYPLVLSYRGRGGYLSSDILYATGVGTGTLTIDDSAGSRLILDVVFTMAAHNAPIAKQVCTLDTQTIDQVLDMRLEYYEELYRNQNKTNALIKATNMKNIIQQSCNYDLDTSEEVLVLQREESFNQCEKEYAKYRNSYIAYLRVGNLTVANQIRAVLDTIDRSGGCTKSSESYGDAYFQERLAATQTQNTRTPMGKAICDNQNYVSSFVEQISAFTDPDRVQTVVDEFEDIYDTAGEEQTTKKELFDITKKIAEGHKEYLISGEGGIAGMNIEVYCRLVNGEFSEVQIIGNFNDYTPENMQQSDDGITWVKQVTLADGETIVFNYLIDGEYVDEDELEYTADGGGDYTIVYDPRQPRRVIVRRIDDAVGEAIDEIQRQRQITAFNTMNTTGSVTGVVSVLNNYNIASIFNGWDYNNYNYTSIHSKNWIAQYVLDNRPVGGWSGDGSGSGDWADINSLVASAISQRRDDLMAMINNATSAGDLSGAAGFMGMTDLANSISQQTWIEGEMLYPFADYLISQGSTYFCCVSLTMAEKQMIVDYVYDNRPYANRNEVSTAIYEGYLYVQNFKYIQAFNTMNTTGSVTGVVSVLNNYNIASIFNGWDYNNYNYTSIHSKNWIAQYVLDNRPVGGWSGDGSGSGDWADINSLVASAISQRRDDLMAMINNATSAGDLSGAAGFMGMTDLANSISQQTWIEGEMLYPFADYLISQGSTYFCCVSLTMAEKQMIVDYVYDNRPYANRNEVSTAIYEGYLYVQNFKYIQAFNTMNTTGSVTGVVSVLNNYNIASIFNGWDYNNYNYTSIHSKNWIAQYVLNNRPVGGWSGDGSGSGDWADINSLVASAISQRRDDLMAMINNATSAGDLSGAAGFMGMTDLANSISQQTWIEGEMLYPFADYLISSSYGTYFCCSSLTMAEKQFIIDYVFNNRPYNTYSEIQAAAQAGASQ